MRTGLSAAGYFNASLRGAKPSADRTAPIRFGTNAPASPFDAKKLADEMTMMWDAKVEAGPPRKVIRQASMTPEEKGYLRISSDKPLYSLGQQAGLTFGDMAFFLFNGHVIQRPHTNPEAPKGLQEFLVSPLIGLAAFAAHGDCGKFEEDGMALNAKIYPETAKVLKQAMTGETFTQKAEAVEAFNRGLEDSGLNYVAGFKRVGQYLSRFLEDSREGAIRP